MKQFRLDSSPIVYYVGGNNHKEWILFLHAAFVSHKMFQSQFAYFESRYNILAVDIIGHGKSTETKKGDSIEKMSAWISDILKAEKIDQVHIAGVSLGAVRLATVIAATSNDTTFFFIFISSQNDLCQKLFNFCKIILTQFNLWINIVLCILYNFVQVNNTNLYTFYSF